MINKSLLLVLLMLLTFGLYAENKLVPKKLLGSQNICLRNDLSSTIKKIGKYQINPKHLWEMVRKQKLKINPYEKLYTKYPQKYIYNGKNELVFKLKQGTFYISFNNSDVESINKENYYMTRIDELGKVEYDESDDVFYVNYYKLKELHINNANYLLRINPSLQKLELDFFYERLYKISYALKMDLKELDYLFSIFKNPDKKGFGNYSSKSMKLSEFKKLSEYKKLLKLFNRSRQYNDLSFKQKNELYTELTWNYKNINIKVLLKRKTYKNLDELDLIRNYPKQFYNQTIHITLLHKPTHVAIQQHKSTVKENVVDDLLILANKQKEKLEASLDSKKTKYENEQEKKTNTRYQHINDLFPKRK